MYYSDQQAALGKKPKQPVLNQVQPIHQKPAGFTFNNNSLSPEAGPQIRTDNLPNGVTRTSLTPEQMQGIEGGSQLAAAASQSVGAVANFGMDVYKASQTGSSGDEESRAKTANLAMSGMAMGATVGSVVPVIGTAIGAVAGAAIGGTAGLLMKVPDRKKRVAKDREEYNGRLFQESDSRRMSAEDAEKEQELEHLLDLQRAQMGHVKI